MPLSGVNLTAFDNRFAHNLLEARAVSLDEPEPRIGLGGDVHVLGVAGGLHGPHGIVDDGLQVDGGPFDAKRA